MVTRGSYGGFKGEEQRMKRRREKRQREVNQIMNRKVGIRERTSELNKRMIMMIHR